MDNSIVYKYDWNDMCWYFVSLMPEKKVLGVLSHFGDIEKIKFGEIVESSRTNIMFIGNSITENKWYTSAEELKKDLLIMSLSGI